MKTAYLDDARQEAVAQAVRDVLHREKALVTQHTASRVVFTGYRPGGDWTWMRSGYVGIYQHVGEPEVEVRLILRARWPSRILLVVAVLDLLALPVTAAVNPEGTMWTAVAGVGGFALLAAGLLHLNTLKSVRREERALMEKLETEFEKALGLPDVESEEERELRRLEEELEGEIARRRFDEARKAAGDKRGFAFPRPRFDLRRKPPAAPPAEEEPAESRIARLRARKAELERLREEQANR